MRAILLSLICLVCASANAGYFIEKSMYSPKFLLVGKGMTQEEAHKDALAALPKEKDGIHYEVDSKSSVTNQCTEGGAPDQSLKSCGSVAWQTTIPLVRVER